MELLPYRDYYRGIFQIYEKWSKELGEENVPMGDHSLVKKAETKTIYGRKR